MNAGELEQTISLAELRHKPAKRARRAFAEATKASQSGNHDHAILALKRSLKIDPD
jgi:hypothetical protein